MSKKVLSFAVALMSFVFYLPIYACRPCKDPVSRFQAEFFEELEEAERILDTADVYNSRFAAISGDTAVVGDLHGDLRVFERIRENLSRELDSGVIQNVVFLGDIMDRGSNSAKTLFELLKFFNEYKGRVHILRGNHETIELFDREGANQAINDPLFKGIPTARFRDFFDRLPPFLIINGHTLAVHGGIPHKSFWSQVFSSKEKIPEDAPGYDAIFSAMWSDYSRRGDAVSMNQTRGGDPRAVYFNETCVKSFFKYCAEAKEYEYCRDIIGGLKYLIRAHQKLDDNFVQSSHGIVTTVFSATDNQGLLVSVRGAKVALVTVEEVPPTLHLVVWPGVPSEEECRAEREFAFPLVSKSPFGFFKL